MSKLLKEFIVYQKPLSVNQLYCITRTGKKYLNPKHKKFKEEMQLNSNNEMFDCKMRIEIEYYIDRVNTSDWDNPNKALGDALENCGIIKNDALLFWGNAIKFHAKRKDIKTVIRLYEFDEEDYNKAKDRDFWYAQYQESLKLIEKYKRLLYETINYKEHILKSYDPFFLNILREDYYKLKVDEWGEK